MMALPITLGFSLLLAGGLGAQERDWTPWERDESTDNRSENPHATYIRERGLHLSSAVPDAERPLGQIGPSRVPGHYQGYLNLGYRRDMSTAADRFAFVTETGSGLTAPAGLIGTEPDYAVEHDRVHAHLVQNLGYRWLNLDLQVAYDLFSTGYNEADGNGISAVTIGNAFPVFQSRNHNLSLIASYVHEFGDEENIPFGYNGIGGQLAARYGYSERRHYFGAEASLYYGIDGEYRVRYTSNGVTNQFTREFDKISGRLAAGYTYRPSLWWRFGGLATLTYDELVDTGSFSELRLPVQAFAEVNPLNILSIQAYVGTSALGNYGDDNGSGLEGGLSLTWLW